MRDENDRKLLDEAYEVARDYVGPEDSAFKRAKLAERIVEVARRHAERIAATPQSGDGT